MNILHPDPKSMSYRYISRWSGVAFIWLMTAFLVLAQMTPCQTKTTPETEDVLIPKLLLAVEKASHFFRRDYEHINVDGLFGIQMGQGQLIDSYELFSKTRLAPQWRTKLRSILDRMNAVIKKALDKNLKQDSFYTQRFLKLLMKPLKPTWNPRQVETNSGPVIHGINDYYDEELGDACISRLLGSYIEANTTFSQCSVSKKCLTFMTQPNTTGYFLTHQLFYFLCVEVLHCEGKLGFKQFTERPTIQDIQRTLCRKIYAEAKMLAKGGYVDELQQDLFAEQTLLCAPLGFVDFLRSDWMNMVLSWQSEGGCFTDGVQNTNYKKRSAATMRKLLREYMMESGCLSHKSGLCYGVLTIYLNNLIRNSSYH